MNQIYHIADKLFFAFHIALILFNIFGWIPVSLRKWNLATLSLTAFSWFVLGIFYGFGYCFLTDWHWQVREQLGYSTESNSYIHFLILELTGWNPHEHIVDTATAAVFFAALGASVTLNIRDRQRRKRQAPRL